jgi:hypothetical protein
VRIGSYDSHNHIFLIAPSLMVTLDCLVWHRFLSMASKDWSRRAALLIE